MDADGAVQRARARLHERGERMTGPRRAVLEALAGSGGHLPADAVVERVAALDPAVHRVSVYRALETLSGLGVVQHVHVGHGRTAYHLHDGDAGGADRPHLHAECRRCGRVLDLPADTLDAVAAVLDAGHGFALDPAHVALSGTCSACRT